MTELQRRVLVEAEFLFYLVTSPALFTTPPGDVHVWVRNIPTSTLSAVNAEARSRLRGGSLALRPLPPIRVVATNALEQARMVRK